MTSLLFGRLHSASMNSPLKFQMHCTLVISCFKMSIISKNDILVERETISM